VIIESGWLPPQQLPVSSLSCKATRRMSEHSTGVKATWQALFIADPTQDIPLVVIVPTLWPSHSTSHLPWQTVLLE
jgi:hypothetical protein